MVTQEQRDLLQGRSIPTNADAGRDVGFPAGTSQENAFLGSGFKDSNGNPVDISRLQGGTYLFDEAGWPHQVVVKPKSGGGTFTEIERLTAAEAKALGLDGSSPSGPSGPSGPAVDPFAAGKFALQKYDAQLAAHSMTVDQAIAAWQADFDEAIANSNIDITNVGNQLSADTTNAQLAGQRAADIAAAESRLNSEATQRADLTQRILRTSLPEGVTLNLPGAGPVPEQIVNIPNLLSQGLPALSDQFSDLPGNFPVANVQPGTVAPLNGPAFPNLPGVPGLPF